MYDIAHTNPKILYKEFGINAEFLIDHSWGKETCTIKDIKNYKTKNTSISNSQVLFEDYNFENARLVLKEMVELNSIKLVEKNLITDTISLYIGYSKNIINSTGGSMKLANYTNTYSDLMAYFLKLYDSTTNKTVPIRRIGVSFNRLVSNEAQQLSLFENQEKITKERKIELAISNIKQKLGKNAIVRGMDLENGATTILRNKLIGGHNAYD